MFTAALAAARVSTPIARSLQNQRMEDFAAKLTVIEWEANLVLEDLAPSVLRDRVQNIATVARLLRLRLEVASGLILPAQPPKPS